MRNETVEERLSRIAREVQERNPPVGAEPYRRPPTLKAENAARLARNLARRFVRNRPTKRKSSK